MIYNYDGNFNKKYSEYKSFADLSIENAFKGLDCNADLLSAMKYSVFAGGKRIRPVLFFATLESLGLDYKLYSEFAVALEFIHTYSLIHDDLPAMDNDDYRRGKPSNHKVYGEAMAILAGDALLNFAYEIALGGVRDDGTLSAAKELAAFSGCLGMVGGQAYDLADKKELSEKTLEQIDDLKTGKLITLPFTMASLIAKEKYYDEFLLIGKNLGRLFQYTDDLLDAVGSFFDLGKTTGKDSRQNKVTAVSVFGLENVKKNIESVFTCGVKILKNIDNNSFFLDFFKFVKDRVS